MEPGRIPLLHARPDPRPNDPGHPSARALAHGSMEVRWYKPDAAIPHHPHDRDEIYVVIAGTASFHLGLEPGPFDEDKLGLPGERLAEVRTGDVMFVPAGAEHHFDHQTEDFAVWAIFYGPEGGEHP